MPTATTEIIPVITEVQVQNLHMPRIEDPLWAQYSDCLNTPDSMATVPKSGPKARGMTSEEKDIIANYCGDCPVLNDCLVDALQSGDSSSIRGGLTPKQREPLSEIYGQRNERRPIPLALWSKAIANASEVKSSHLNTAATKNRSIKIRSRIIELLQDSEQGWTLQPDSETLHIDIAKELRSSAILVRQQLIGLIFEGIIISDGIRNPGSQLRMTSVRLNTAA